MALYIAAALPFAEEQLWGRPFPHAKLSRCVGLMKRLAVVGAVVPSGLGFRYCAERRAPR